MLGAWSWIWDKCDWVIEKLHKNIWEEKLEFIFKFNKFVDHGSWTDNNRAQKLPKENDWNKYIWVWIK